MKKIQTFIITIILVLILLPTYLVNAQSSANCPESMPIEKRYTCLQDERDKMGQNQGSLQKKLKDEDYQQLTLNEKIKYINTQVEQTQRVIEGLHLEISTKDVEIKILAQEIQSMEDVLTILKQEIYTLEDIVNKRITESYKYSHMGIFELFMDVKNIETVLRKTKYLMETRVKDKSSLKEYNEKKVNLEDEEILLVEKRAELQTKRNEVEDEKTTLVAERNNLDSQKAEQGRLLAESERREKQYKVQLETLSKVILETDNVISDIAYQLFLEGKLGNGSPVVGGQTSVGRQGHTGCSYGSHLHLEVRNSSGTKLNPENFFTVNGRYLYNGIYPAPYPGAYITQNFASHNTAIDMVSFSSGNQNGDSYTVQSGLCAAVDRYINLYGNQVNLRGEGAYVKALASGTVYYGVYQTGVASNPTKYAFVKHNDGNTSFYLHIQ